MALSDLPAAILLHLKASSEISAIVSDRVYIGWPKNRDGSPKIVIPPYQNVVLIEPGRGGQGYLGLGYHEERADIRCYGTDARVAYNLWNTVNEYLMKTSERTSQAFRYANTRIMVVEQESGPLRLVDEDADGWNFTSCGYLFRYCPIV